MATSASTGQIMCPGLPGLNPDQMQPLEQFFSAKSELYLAFAHIRQHPIRGSSVYCFEQHAICTDCARKAALRMASASTLHGLLPEEQSHLIQQLHIGCCTVGRHALMPEGTRQVPQNVDECFCLCFTVKLLDMPAQIEPNRPPAEWSYRTRVFLLFLAFFGVAMLGLILDKEFPTARESHLCINGSSTGVFSAFCSDIVWLFAAMFQIPTAIIEQFAGSAPNVTNDWSQWAVQGCHRAIPPLYNISDLTCSPILPVPGPITEAHPVAQMLLYAWKMLATQFAAQGAGFINGTIASPWVLKRVLASCLQIVNQGIPGVLLPGLLMRAIRIYWQDPNNAPPDVLAQLKQAIQRILDLYLHQQWGPAIENFPRN